MPNIVTPSLEKIAKEYAEIERHIRLSRLDAERACKGYENELAAWKKFIASCDDGLSGRLQKIAGIKPEKIKAECAELIKTVNKYHDNCTKLKNTLSQALDETAPVAGIAIADFAQILVKLKPNLEKLEKNPEDSNLKKAIAAAGKTWSEKKSLNDARIPGLIKSKSKEAMGSAEKEIKILDKIVAYFGTTTLQKIELIDKLDEKKSKEVAKKVAPLAAALVKASQTYHDATSDNFAKGTAEALIKACKKLQENVNQATMG